MEDVKRDFSDIVLPPALQVHKHCAYFLVLSACIAVCCRGLHHSQHSCFCFQGCPGHLKERGYMLTMNRTRGE